MYLIESLPAEAEARPLGQLRLRLEVTEGRRPGQLRRGGHDSGGGTARGVTITVHRGFFRVKYFNPFTFLYSEFRTVTKLQAGMGTDKNGESTTTDWVHPPGSKVSD